MENLKITDIKVDWSGVELHDPNDNSVNDGANGYLVEDHLEQVGLPIDRAGTTDLPGIEVKTMQVKPKAQHTIGRMSYTKVVNTSWSATSLKAKMNRQYQVIIASNGITGKGRVTNARVVDYTHPAIQCELEAAYEDCRKQIISNGKDNNQTVKSGPAIFEWRPSKKNSTSSGGYQFRIAVKAMRGLTGTAIAIANDLFEIQ